MEFSIYFKMGVIQNFSGGAKLDMTQFSPVEAQLKNILKHALIYLAYMLILEQMD